jgi:hypothetical protein
MDGRIQIPVIDYVKRRFHVRYVDMITELGPVRILSGKMDAMQLQSIRRRLEISTWKHGLKSIARVTHHDCAANPVDMETQLQQLAQSMATIRSWGFGMEIIGVWVDENWKPRRI